MNFTFSNTNSFKSLTDVLCNKVDDNSYSIKKEYGKGTIKEYNIENGLIIRTIEICIKNPLLGKWSYSKESLREYYLFFNLSDTHEEGKTINGELIEEGATAFTQNNDRIRVWLPNISYKLLLITFNQAWYDKLIKTITFPNTIISNLSSVNNLYLRTSIHSNSKIVLTQLFNEIETQTQCSYTYLEIKAIELMYIFFSEVFQTISEEKHEHNVHPNDVKQLNIFMGTLNDNIEALPNIKEASEELNMSESKFQRIFKSILGTTYYDFVFKLRMDTSMELLINKISVTEVAIKTGYSSIGNFSNAFKRYFGMSPSEIVNH
ncbi:helix-turn-helix transcriptional regulator [Saccharicrinis aurantiacus]|uniref:helix-turn-helix transcriptional regulator n=1 Tax=Saccharicrinis aurantiacus TaxID=1849719 RepID=UPI00094F5871|nr:helix-turn-helix transcriptional regulator [Saccharicrinis aurantiacus]